MVENKKTLYMAVAAAGVVLGAAVLWYSWSGRKSSETVADKLQKAKLTEIKKSDNGQLDQNYFLQLLQFIA